MKRKSNPQPEENLHFCQRVKGIQTNQREQTTYQKAAVNPLAKDLLKGQVPVHP